MLSISRRGGGRKRSTKDMKEEEDEEEDEDGEADNEKTVPDNVNPERLKAFNVCAESNRREFYLILKPQ
jgi:hypothetical protein